MLSIRIKIYCIQNLTEARLAIRYGASALSLVGLMPSGPGVIDNVRIAERPFERIDSNQYDQPFT